MSKDAITKVDLSVSGEPSMGFAPPFRAMLSTPAIGESIHHHQEAGADFPVVPGYAIVAELGRGGMGVVYLARQCSLNRQVALKMIGLGLHADPTARARFRTEAEAVARLQHPNVVEIHEVGEHDGRPFLSLEHVAGGSLAGQPARPDREAALLVETLARAVHYTHQHGILHRDLKPGNVLLTAEGIPKITDFGLARFTGQDGVTGTRELIGTPNYMSPEQVAGDPGRIGVPTDVYSLGAILYELLTGFAHFRGASVLHTLLQVWFHEPISPRRLRRTVSRDLETICLKCLEKEPSRRYPSAESLADDLHRFLEGQPIQARPIPVWQRLWRHARRRPAAVGWTLAAVVLVGLLLTAWSWSRTADQLGQHRNEEKYRGFIKRRNEAFVHGLLAPDEGALFLGAEADANLQAAELAAREALALAGADAESETLALAGPASRKAEMAADCYSLLLVLASIKGQPPAPGEGGKGQCREALRLLNRACRLGFQTRAYHLRRAYFLEQLGEHQEARKDRERAAAQVTQSALDHFLIGEEHYRRGEWDRARNSFSCALSQQPGHFWAQFFLGVCHLKARNWEGAKASFNACLGQEPDFVWAYLFRSFANEKLQVAAEAKADFLKALQLNPNEDARYVLFLARGIHHFNQKELARAAADFQAATALKPEQYNAYLNLAHVHLAQGEFDRAAEQARTLNRLRPPALALAGYHLELGRALLRDRKYNEAVEECTAASEQCPQWPLPCEVSGRALLALGRHAAAEKAFTDHVRKSGEEKSDIFRGRGQARMKLGKYAEAVDDYTRALEHAPDADIHQHRGWAYFFSDAWKLALRDFSKAIELDPHTADSHIGRGLAHVMLGQYREAVADADAGQRLTPGSPEMTHNLACIFAQAVARAEADTQEANRQSLANDYRHRALEAIRQTLVLLRPEERASFWQSKIAPDAALIPIRNDAEFKRLQDEQVRQR